MMIILGFNCFGHDAAASLLIDGEVVFAMEEERINRKKHFGGIPAQSIKSCMEFAGISLSDIDHITFSWKPSISYLHIPEFLFRYWDKVPALLREQKHFTVEENLGMLNYLGDMRRLPATLRNIFPDKKKSRFAFHLLEHHLCHAASAFYPSPFEEAAILTIDGAGEWTTALMAYGRGSEIIKKKEVKTPHSLGAMYQSVARHLGFQLITGPGKLMGLASYGDKNAEEYRQMKKLIRFCKNGTFKLDMSYFSYHYTRKTGVSKKFEALFGKSKKEQGGWSEHELNVAAAVQHITEDVILHMAGHLRQTTGSRNICLAGGVALNSVANGLLVKSGLFEHVFIQPAAGDSGTSLGSALLCHHQKLKGNRQYSMNHAFLGLGYDDSDYEQALKNSGLQYQIMDDDFTLISKKLAEGCILGWYQGRLEFGPRALGNRSILASPIRSDAKDVLNARVKFREGFRPFAAIVLEEDCGIYFDCSYPSPFMLKVYEVKPEYRKLLPGITHVDHTVRVQTVNKTDLPPMRRLLASFKKLTGISCLINTSFNIKGEPIVCTPEDAIDSFTRADMDYLVMGNYIVRHPNATAFKK